MCGDGRQGREAVTAGPVHGILAGYDGSPGSEQALTGAAREARAREAVLTVCQAWAPGYPASAAEVAAFDLARRSGEGTVARGVRYARALMGSSEVRPLLVAGRAAHVLCQRSADAAPSASPAPDDYQVSYWVTEGCLSASGDQPSGPWVHWTDAAPDCTARFPRPPTPEMATRLSRIQASIRSRRRRLPGPWASSAQAVRGSV